jgi:DNA-binding transcriptional MerR regulator
LNAMPKHFPRPGELSTGELAEYLNINRRTLISRLRAKIIPEPRRRGNKRIWTQKEAEELKTRPEGQP